MKTALTTLKANQLNPINLGVVIETHSEALIETTEHATSIFKKNQAEQQKTINAQSKLIEDLQASLIKEREEKIKLQKTHEASLKALQNKKEAQITNVSHSIDSLLKTCDEISQLQTDLPFVFQIAYGKNLIETSEGARIDIGAGRDFPGGSIYQFIAYHTAKVQGRYDPKAREDVIGNLTAETKRKIETIETLFKSIKEEIRK